MGKVKAPRGVAPRKTVEESSKEGDESSTLYNVGELRKQRERQPADHITPMQEAFIQIYVLTRDPKQSALDAGYSPTHAPIVGKRLLTEAYYPLVVRKIRELFGKQQQQAAMDGAMVLKYIQNILTFCPADWFLPADGGWLISMEDYRVLPDFMRMIVEEMETRSVELPDGTRTDTLWVRFVSKSQALQLAAKYTLGDKVDDVPQIQIDWVQLFGRQPKQIAARVVVVEGTPSAPPESAPPAWNDPVEAELNKLEALLPPPQPKTKEDAKDKAKKVIDAILSKKPKP